MESNDDFEWSGRVAEPKSFNWLRDKDGLALLFPRSRIMLYDYASAWRGTRKVKATISSICTMLLELLAENRKVRVTRYDLFCLSSC